MGAFVFFAFNIAHQPPRRARTFCPPPHDLTARCPSAADLVPLDSRSAGRDIVSAKNKIDALNLEIWKFGNLEIWDL
jgi:hypothetical protein